MFGERTSVGLDVHARSVVAAAIDGQTGEVFKARLTPSHADVLEWIARLPGPCAVVYESGPTGFGLGPGVDGGGVAVRGGGVIEAAAPGRGSGEDRRARRPAPGPVVAAG